MHLRRVFPLHRLVLAAVVVLIAVLVRLPQTAFAGECEDWNPAVSTPCQLDVAQYGIYESVASTIWLINRILLGGAYWMDALRYQFIQVIFTGAYDALSDAIGPLLGPMAILALTVGALALIAVPVTGSSGPINVRNVLIWCVVGPMLLTMSGPYLVQFEQTRADIGTLLFSSVTGGTLTIGSGAAHDMAKPQSIYPSGDCGANGGQPILRRYSQADMPNVDEQVAALAWATAKDIHCPDRPLPMNLYNDGSDGPGYVRYGGIRDLNDGDRQRYLASVKECINRLLLMIAPAFVATLMSLLNFVFACCTMMLWFSIPLGLLFSFFQTNANWVTNLVQRAAGVLKTSWLMSILLGIFSSILFAAGSSGDALRYSIMTIIAGLFVAKFAFTAFGLFSEAMTTMTSVTGLGGSDPSLGRMAGGAASTAFGAATGGVSAVAGAALTAAVAKKHTGSGRYAAAAAAGRIKPLMQLGEVAASMGLVDDEVASGLYAGHRSAQSLRSGRMAMHGDARRLDTVGRAEERSIERQMRQADHGNLVQRTVRDGQHMVQAGRAVAGAVGRELTEERLLRGGVHGIDAAVNVMRNAISNPGVVAAQVRQTGAAAGVQTLRHSKLVGSQAKEAARRHLMPQDHSRMAMSFHKGRLQHEPRVEGDQIPAGAITERADARRMRALLREGNTVQRNDDGTVTSWKPQGAQSTDTATSRSPKRTVTPQPELRHTSTTGSSVSLEARDEQAEDSTSVAAASTDSTAPAEAQSLRQTPREGPLWEDAATLAQQRRDGEVQARAERARMVRRTPYQPPMSRERRTIPAPPPTVLAARRRARDEQQRVLRDAQEARARSLRAGKPTRTGRTR